MRIRCERCSAHTIDGMLYPRAEFVVKRKEKLLVVGGRPGVEVRHVKCGYRWVVPASAAIGRDAAARAEAV